MCGMVFQRVVVQQNQSEVIKMNKKDIRSLVALWFVWAVILFLFQAFITARLPEDLAEILRLEQHRDPVSEPYLSEPFMNGSVAWAERYFETASPQVAGFIGQLRELAAAQIAPPLPDITASLRALQKRREGMLQGGES